MRNKQQCCCPATWWGVHACAISNSVAVLLQGGECMHACACPAISNSVAVLLQGGECMHACACPAISNSVAVLLQGGECMHARTYEQIFI